jgi:microcystin-dependent protein
MSGFDSFLAELKIVSFNFAPKGWALCNGQLLPINNNQALFSLLGTTYGGNGQTNFALPDFRGRVPMHFGNHSLGERAGQESHTITMSEMPQHVHFLNVSNANASTDTPDSSLPAPNLELGIASLDLYHAPTNLVAMEPGIVGNVGGSQPHENRQPFLALNVIIALQGIFPTRN